MSRKRADELDLSIILKAFRRGWLQLTRQDAIAAVYDVFDALDFETKDGQTPTLVKRVRTDYGWRLIWHLPAGITSRKITEQLDAFEEQVDGRIVLERHGADIYMDIVDEPLPVNVPYEWQPQGSSLQIPIGMTHSGMVTVDLSDLPHLFCAGNTGGGKTTFLRSVAVSCLRQGAAIAIVDLKFGMEYTPFEGIAPVVYDPAEVHRLLLAINDEMYRRAMRLKAAGVTSLKDYRGDLPWAVLIIDELAEIQGKDTLRLLDRILRLGRAPGISVVAATQRPAHDILPKFANLRMLFAGRLCFSMPKQEDSGLILGNNLASKLPRNVPGRAIWQYEAEGVEVQCPHLRDKDVRTWLRGLPNQEVLAIERSPRRLPPR